MRFVHFQTVKKMKSLAVALLVLQLCQVSLQAQESPFSKIDYKAIVERDPRPREEIQAFVKDLSSTDAKFEVIVGQGRLLTLKDHLTKPGESIKPLIAVGDPSVFDFIVIDTRHLRITGQRIGVTDLSIITSNGESYEFEVSVVFDLTLVEAKLRMLFPDAQLKLVQHREHVIVQGQARDTRQVQQILEMIQTFLDSAQTTRSITGQSKTTGQANSGPNNGGQGNSQPDLQGIPPQNSQGNSEGGNGSRTQLVINSSSVIATAKKPESKVINLIRVPGPQQVMLKVQVAELDRTALRRLGTSFLLQDGNYAIGSTIGPSFPTSGGAGGGAGGGAAGGLGGGLGGGLLGLLNPVQNGSSSTLFGIFNGGKATLLVDALRQNQVLTILAEPTLVALHGHEASFQSGGTFPVLVPQPGGGQAVFTIEYQDFGISLDFIPFILDDETIRLAVAAEVSSIDFSTGVVIDGNATPGTRTRNVQTSVELRQGQTLAIAGILQVEMAGTTSRIPGLGDLPVLGTMFRNTTNQRMEKELVILVSPYMVEAMNPDQVPALPGAMVAEPNDRELYIEGRLEGRGFGHYRSTEAWDDPIGVTRIRRVESVGRAYLR